MKRSTFALFLFLSTVALVVSVNREERPIFGPKVAKSFTTSGFNFVKDGNPFTIVSGSIHYFRVHPDLWEDRLTKAKLGGLNTIETYVAWNLHQPSKNEFYFGGFGDIAKFLKICQKVGLLVILRPTPYICAEWDFGGFPSWLLAERDVQYRCNNEKFLRYHDQFLEKFVPIVRSFQYNRYGGPIIMLQIENEYGSFGTDLSYILHLKHSFTSLGMTDVILNMCGGFDDISQSSIPDGLLRTINAGVGTNVTAMVQRMKEFGEYPRLVTEYYPGWLDHWTEAHHTQAPNVTIGTFGEMLKANTSVNFYMYHGGTNFGFMNGANSDPKDDTLTNFAYQPITTSYDYDAPISESGELTPKFFAIREIIRKYVKNVGEPPVPTEVPVVKAAKAYGKVEMTSSCRMLFNDETQKSLSLHSKPANTPNPVLMEDNNQDYGFIHYRTMISSKIQSKWQLKLWGLTDRAMVFSNQIYQGTLYRNNPGDSILVGGDKGTVLDILVENMGRLNFWINLISDRKGIQNGILLDNRYLNNITTWSYPLRTKDISKLKFVNQKSSSPNNNPTFFKGEFNVEGTPQDTFLAMDGWTKGVAWINGFNLGRYWNVGPQKTLYLPAPLLNSGKNELVILELHNFVVPRVVLVDKPNLNNGTSSY